MGTRRCGKIRTVFVSGLCLLLLTMGFVASTAAVSKSSTSDAGMDQEYRDGKTAFTLSGLEKKHRALRASSPNHTSQPLAYSAKQLSAASNNTTEIPPPALTLHNLSYLSPVQNLSQLTAGGGSNTVYVFNGTEYTTTRPPALDTGEADPSGQPSRTGVTDYSSAEWIANGATPTANSGVIGRDTRQQVTRPTKFPYSPVVEFRIITRSGKSARCSGALITEENTSEHSYHVLTAGHCVYIPSEGGWIDIQPPAVDGDNASVVIPAAAGGDRPYGSVSITKIRTYGEWVNGQQPFYDLAVLTLERRVGQKTGSLGYTTGPIDSPLYSHNQTRVVGYPGDKGDRTQPTMWSSVGKGRGTVGHQNPEKPYPHLYRMDVFSGMSGGPVWIEDLDDFELPRLVSINVYAADLDRDGETDFNLGTRLTTTRVLDIQRWMAQDDAQLQNNVQDRNPVINAADVNSNGVIEREEVVAAIVAYNTESRLNGRLLSRQDVISIIVKYNTAESSSE